MLSFICERRSPDSILPLFQLSEIKKKVAIKTWTSNKSLWVNKISSAHFPSKLTFLNFLYSPPTSKVATSLRGASITWREEAADETKGCGLCFLSMTAVVRGRRHRVLPLGHSGRPLTAVPGTGMPLLSTHQHMPMACQHWMGVYWPCSSHWGLRLPSRCFTEASSSWHLVITGAECKHGKYDEKDQEKKKVYTC